MSTQLGSSNRGFYFCWGNNFWTGFIYNHEISLLWVGSPYILLTMAHVSVDIILYICDIIIDINKR